MTLIVNNQLWKILFVNPNDKNLITNNGIYTLGMTDNNVKTVFISNALRGKLLYKVLCHELCHVYCFSYGIKLSIMDEERLAQFVSEYGNGIITNAEYLLSYMFDNKMVL